jgi:hypothetical protein
MGSLYFEKVLLPFSSFWTLGPTPMVSLPLSEEDNDDDNDDNNNNDTGEAFCDLVFGGGGGGLKDSDGGKSRLLDGTICDAYLVILVAAV